MGHEVSSDLIANLFVFVLSSFLGMELIKGVSRLLHTPLMSLTNAIASIAVACSMVNAVGGFLITERILKMFKK